MNKHVKLRTAEHPPILPNLGRSKVDDILDRMDRESWNLWDLTHGLFYNTYRQARIDLLEKRFANIIAHLRARADGH